MKLVSLALVAAFTFSAQAMTIIPHGSITFFEGYSKIEGQKATYVSKATYAVGDDWEAFPGPEAFFPADTALCFSGSAWGVEAIVHNMVEGVLEDTGYELTFVGDEDDETISISIVAPNGDTKTFPSIGRCL